MDKSRKLTLIQEQIDQAALAKASSTETETWSLKALATLRVTLGEDRTFYARATTVRFSPVVVNLGDDQRAFVAARSRGIDEMVSILVAAHFEIQYGEAGEAEVEHRMPPQPILDSLPEGNHAFVFMSFGESWSDEVASPQ
jgi:hypothetical protein